MFKNLESMKTVNKHLIKNTAIFALSNFSSKIAVVVLVPIYTYKLTPEEYGIFDIIYSSILLLFPILSCNIVDGVARFLLDNEHERNQINTIGFLFILISCIIVCALCFILYAFKFIHEILAYSCDVIYLYVSYALYTYLTQIAKGDDNAKVIAIASLLSSIQLIIYTLLFLFVINLGVRAILVGTALSFAVTDLYLFLKLKIRINFHNINHKIQYEMLAYSTPIICTGIGWWINSYADKYILTFFAGLTATGLLTVGYKIPQVLSTFLFIFIQAWQISAIKEYKKSGYKKLYTDNFDYLMSIASIVCSILILLNKPIVGILFSDEYFNCYIFIPYLLVSSVFSYAAGYFGPILSAQKNSKAMALSAIYGSIINIVFNFALIFYMGPIGVAISTMLSSIIIFIVRYSYAKTDLLASCIIRSYFVWTLLIVQATIESYKVSFSYIFEILLLLSIVIINHRIYIFIVSKICIFIFKLLKKIKEAISL